MLRRVAHCSLALPVAFAFASLAAAQDKPAAPPPPAPPPAKPATPPPAAPATPPPAAPATPPAKPATPAAAPSKAAPAAKTVDVVFETTLGNFTIRVNAEKAPATAENFLKYVDDGYYNGTTFHRVIATFMVQGGGYAADLKPKAGLRPPVKNEADNGLKNLRGTVAMARTSDPNSATSQFFVNVVDNTRLDFTSPDPRGWGYAVFGEVVSGMDVVDKIRAVPTCPSPSGQCTQPLPPGMRDVPATPVVINKAARKK